MAGRDVYGRVFLKGIPGGVLSRCSLLVSGPGVRALQGARGGLVRQLPGLQGRPGRRLQVLRQRRAAGVRVAGPLRPLSPRQGTMKVEVEVQKC